jgi:hypothetical protein
MRLNAVNLLPMHPQVGTRLDRFDVLGTEEVE